MSTHTYNQTQITYGHCEPSQAYANYELFLLCRVTAAGAAGLRPLSTSSDKSLYLTFPPQNWHSSPCQPSAQTQVPFPQTPPFMQVMSVHLTSVAAAATKTHTHNIAVSVQQAVAVHPFRTHFCRYFTLNRHKNIWKNSLNILVREPFFCVWCGVW